MSLGGSAGAGAGSPRRPFTTGTPAPLSSSIQVTWLSNPWRPRPRRLVSHSYEWENTHHVPSAIWNGAVLCCAPLNGASPVRTLPSGVQSSGSLLSVAERHPYCSPPHPVWVESK